MNVDEEKDTLLDSEMGRSNESVVEQGGGTVKNDKDAGGSAVGATNGGTHSRPKEQGVPSPSSNG